MKDTKKFAAVVVAVIWLMIGATPASALLEVHSGSVSFASDLEGDKDINLPSFDTTGGRILNSVLVELFYSGSADILADNDDVVKDVNANARIVRSWSATGPGVSDSDNHTVTSLVVELLMDNGDGGVLDANGPDGHDFSGDTAFTDRVAGLFTPATGDYDTDGVGQVAFTVTPTFISNGVQFNPVPSNYQMEAQNSDLTVTATVTYNYVPEPTTMALLGLGSVVLRRKRRL